MDENEYLYGNDAQISCVVCGRDDTLLLPYSDGESLACVECIAMENGETTDE